MLGVIIFIVLAIGLCRRFWHTATVILIWQPVLVNVVFGTTQWRLYFLLSIFTMALVVVKMITHQFSWQKFPFRWPFYLLIFSYFTAGWIFDFRDLLRTTCDFAIPVIVWFAKDRIKAFPRWALINLCIFAAVITTIGIIESVLKVNVVAIWLEMQGWMSFVDADAEHMRFDATRCRSIMIWNSTYGVYCGFVLLTLLFMRYYNVLRSNVLLTILSAALCYGLVSCFGRSVYVTIVVAMITIAMLYGKKIRYVAVALAICWVGYLSNQVLFDNIVDSFIHHEDAGGSSVSVRQGQFDVAMKYFSLNPLTGQGNGFTATAIERNAQLYGAESWVYYAMIDRGAYGTISYILLNISMVLYLLKRRRYRFLVFIPLAVFIGKTMSLFPGIEYYFPILWLAILTRIVDDKERELLLLKRNSQE